MTGASLALAGVCWAYHAELAWYLEGLRPPLGALRAMKAVPLYANFNVNLSLWLVPALLVVGAFVWAAPRFFLGAQRLGTLLAVAVPAFWAVCLSVSMIDGYKKPFFDDEWHEAVPSFAEPFAQKYHEFFWDVRLVDKFGGPRGFLGEFSGPRVQERISLHGGTHPPGAALFLWAAAGLFGYTYVATSLAAIAFTALAVVFTGAIAWLVAGGAAARIAVALMLVTPTIVLFTATSMDGPSSVGILAAILVFVHAMVRPVASPWLHGAALGVTLALSALMTWATLGTAVFFAAFAFWCWRDGLVPLPRSAALLSFGAFVFVLANLVLVWWSGYQPLAALAIARANDESMMGTGHETLGRYLNIAVANVAAFVIGVGLPTAVLWLGRFRDAVAKGGFAAVFCKAALFTVLFMATATLYTLEVERIWFFAVPFAVIPAALVIDGALERRALFATAVTLLAAQTILMEAFLNTRW